MLAWLSSLDRLAPYIYGAGLLVACVMAALSRHRLVGLAGLVLVADYLATKVVLAFQPYPGALWAWPVVNIVGSFCLMSLRLRQDRPSLTAIAGVYLIRAGWLDIRYAFGGDAYSYVLATNLAFLLQLVVLSSEGMDAAADFARRWGSGMRVRLVRLAGAQRLRAQP